MSNINAWVYNRIISSTAVNAIINGNCFPNNVPAGSIPGIAYTILSGKVNLLCKYPIMSIRCVETNQDLCEDLFQKTFKLFDGTTQKIQELYGDLKIEGVQIENHVSSLYDFTNNLWHGILDISIYYEQ